MKLVFKTLISGRGSLDEATASSVPWTFRFFENLINFVVAVKNCSCGCVVPTAHDYQNIWHMLDFPGKIADSISTMVHYLSPSVQWRCCKKRRSYPYDPTVESCRSLAWEKSVVQRLFKYPYISVESGKTHSQDRSNIIPKVPSFTAWTSHHISLKMQVPRNKLIGQKGMRSDAMEVAVNARFWMNIFVQLLSLEST